MSSILRPDRENTATSAHPSVQNNRAFYENCLEEDETVVYLDNFTLTCHQEEISNEMKTV